MHRYEEWAVLTAAKSSAANWRKQRYRDGTLKVPENRRYLAANSAKRNPNNPRGARFPARPSKRDQSSTPDDDSGSDDGRIPILPPGPLTMGNSAGFPNGAVNWTPGLPFNHPIQPIPGPSQLPYSGYFPQTQVSTTTSNVPWGPINQQSPPSSGTPTSLNYWENPPPCA